MDNYHLISVLSDAWREREKAVQQQLVEFLEKNKLFPNNQCGFQTLLQQEDQMCDSF